VTASDEATTSRRVEPGGDSPVKPRRLPASWKRRRTQHRNFVNCVEAASETAAGIDVLSVASSSTSSNVTTRE